jgi:T4 RnlA family RNA ligase
LEEFVNSIPEMQEKIEGYVIVLKSGVTFKCKLLTYQALHKLKENVDHPRHLYELVVHEGHDDLRAAFPDDAYLMGKIDEMVERVKALYTDIKHNVNDFYEANKELDRKRYAILAQSTVKKPFFGLAMNLYVGKSYSEKEFLIKNYKEFGIKDVDIVEE